MKKIMMMLSIVFVGLTLTGCREKLDITLTTDTNNITIIEGEEYTITPSTNDIDGVTYEVDKDGIITLDSSGKITAVSEGEVTVKVTSVSDPSITTNVTVTVMRQITLTSETSSIELIEGETEQLVISSNDDYTFESTNTDLLIVNETGLLTAKEAGTTSVKVVSIYNPDVFITIPVTITKYIDITLERDSYIMVVGDEDNINATSQDGLTYQTSDQNIVTVNSSGHLVATGYGEATIHITSTYRDTVTETVHVMVYKYVEGITIDGPEMLFKGVDTAYEITTSPVGAFEAVTWESSDEDVATISPQGVVSPLTAGYVTITATSTLDQTVVDTFTINIVDALIVDSTASDTEPYDFKGVSLVYGQQLFSTVQAAIDAVSTDSYIYIVEGTYTDAININKDNVRLSSLDGNAELDCTITISANHILIENINFTNTAKIINTNSLDDFTFTNNVVSSITSTVDPFMALDSAMNIYITDNQFSQIGATALQFNNLSGQDIIIQQNSFSNVATALSLQSSALLDDLTEIKIFWNTIDTADTAFVTDLVPQPAIFAVARFNSVTNYTTAVQTELNSVFDFTLNYWGTTTLESTAFVNVSDHYLQGAYSTIEDMPTSLTYDPTLPIIITITNPIEEIMIGETHTYEYAILPLELADAPIRFITLNPTIVAVSQTGEITPLTSGAAGIQIRSAIVSSIRTEDSFSVITTPGIELSIDHVMNDIIVGDSFTLSYDLFPYTIENETATIVSNNEAVATVDASGVVSTHAEGLVSFTASLDSDPNVNTTFTTYVYGALDTNNLLDYLTTKQVSYSEIHSWIAYGFQYNYNDTRAESVSRYYFGNLVINDSKMVPVSYGIRPGEPMDPLPATITGFNPQDIYWIVVHDTASTATGSNALAHANYLYNNAIAGTELWTSWHFTIDDHDVYQHLPEDERGYHAGDGSTSPGEGSYLGGGNRNGIGIEMSVNDDGDMYRTWQRTAKLVVDLLVRHDMPITQMKYHNDFSGKDCPNTLRNAGLIPLFEEFVAVEYYVRTEHPNAEITFVSNNPDYLDDHGRIIQIPERAITVSYTITITEDGTTESRTFYTYIPGTVR